MNLPIHLLPQSSLLEKVNKYAVSIVFIITYLVHNHIAEHNLTQNGRAMNDESTSTLTNNHKHIHKTNAKFAYTDSHSPYHIMDPAVRISFQLHDPSNVPVPDKFLSVKPYMCGTDKGALPPTLSSKTVLNFTTTISTDLRIVHLGDSLGQQFVQGFDATVLGSGYDENRVVLQQYFYNDNIYSHNCLSVAAPTRGGGVSAYWRVTDLIAKFNRGRGGARCAKEELKLKQRVGWSMDQSAMLVQHKYHFEVVDSRNETSEQSFPAGPFDAVIMRIPHGWMDIPDITRERLLEAIELAHENLNVQTVIITTLPLNNNVLNASDWRGIHNINGMIRDVSTTWKGTPGKGVQWILVQEFGEFTNQILWKNAEHLGYNASVTDLTQQQQHKKGWEVSGADFLLDRLPLAKRNWPPSIPMVCAKRPTSKTEKNCIRNKISSDGIHWCLESLGSRYSASIACLLGCVYNGNGSIDEKSSEGVSRCERECNEQFMSIAPVDERWIGSETTIFSQSSNV